MCNYHLKFCQCDHDSILLFDLHHVGGLADKDEYHHIRFPYDQILPVNSQHELHPPVLIASFHMELKKVLPYLDHSTETRTFHSL